MSPSSHAPTDQQLAWRVAAGDPAAFGTLLDRYGGRVQRLARRYAQSESDAEDLTQEIFLDVFRSAASFRGEAQLGTWVYRVALNHCLRHREKLDRERARLANDEDAVLEAPDHGADPTRPQARKELSSQVHAALEKLPALHRDVIVLHELHGLTYQECAKILDVPVGTVKSRLSNAFKALRTSLGPYVLGQPSGVKPHHDGAILPAFIPAIKTDTVGGSA